jgi:hypothetical protein
LIIVITRVYLQITSNDALMLASSLPMKGGEKLSNNSTLENLPDYDDEHIKILIIWGSLASNVSCNLTTVSSAIILTTLTNPTHEKDFNSNP